MSTVQITCSTPDSQIYYTLDGNDPDPSSNLYSSQFEVNSSLTVKAKAYKEGYDSSDISSFDIKIPVVPMVLSDNSILFYDRGEEYGSYHLNEEGYPVRDDGLVDDETAESQNWRYLICNDKNLEDSRQWGPLIRENLFNESLGAGLSNTNYMISKYGEDSTYWWEVVLNRRETTGFKWFIPSYQELRLFRDNRNEIGELGREIPTNLDVYSTSCETDSFSDPSRIGEGFDTLYFTGGGAGSWRVKSLQSDTGYHTLLLRRI